MHSLLCALAAYALNASWEILLLAGAGWLASRWVRRCGPAAEHNVWVSVFLLGAALPLASLAGLSWPGPFRAASEGAVSLSMTAAEGTRALRSGAWTLPEWLLWLVAAGYVGSVLYAAGRLLSRLQQTAVLVRSSRSAELSAEREALWERARQSFAVSGVALRCTEKVRGVAAAGWSRRVVLVAPDFAERCTEEEFLSAMGHELAHLERRDPAKNLAYETVGLLVAFHPANWIVKRRMSMTREMVCDATAVERLVGAKAYRQSLLHLAQLMVGSSPAAAQALGLFDGNALEERMMRLRAKSAMVRGAVRAGLVAAATMLLAMTAASGALAKGVTADQDAKYGTVYHLGPGVTNPKLVNAPDPEYSIEARRAKYQGVCVVGLIVDTKGDPQRVRVVRPLGKGLDQKALEAVRRYRFEPALHEGKPVAAAIRIEVNFRVY